MKGGGTFTTSWFYLCILSFLFRLPAGVSGLARDSHWKKRAKELWEFSVRLFFFGPQSYPWLNRSRQWDLSSIQALHTDKLCFRFPFLVFMVHSLPQHPVPQS